jgi:hypothetical protein
MIFNREDLIQKVKDEIARRRQAAADENWQLLADYNAERETYLSETSEAWNQFANTIKRRIKAGTPVTPDDIPRTLTVSPSGPGRVYLGLLPSPPSGRKAHTSELQTVLDLLDQATNEKISTTELERMGFKIAHLFRPR